MLSTAHIRQIAASDPLVYAFRIEGGATADEMAALADVMNAAFDRDEKVNMLLVLHEFGAAPDKHLPDGTVVVVRPDGFVAEVRDAVGTRAAKGRGLI